jgi:hypothetical protein
MTDAAVLAKKLALIETCLSDLRRLARPDALATDVREHHLGDFYAFVAALRRGFVVRRATD